MPIASMHMGEGPLNPLEGEAVRDPRILVNVFLVVIVNKLVPKCLTKDNQNDCPKEEADNAWKTDNAGARRKLDSAAALQRSFLPQTIFHWKEDAPEILPFHSKLAQLCFHLRVIRFEPQGFAQMRHCFVALAKL